jgi:hypothetical protein
MRLDSSKWTVTDVVTGKNVTEATDNDPETVVTLQGAESAASPPGLVIDLGQSCVLHRVYLTGRRHKAELWKSYENREKPPLGLVVAYVGDTPHTKTRAGEFVVPYDGGSPVDVEMNLRFHPLTGRYVRLELQTDVVWGKDRWPGWNIKPQPRLERSPWNVAEIEIYGFTGADAGKKLDAVVLPKDAAAPLALAADELSYYLGELSGRPYPVIAADEAGDYPGTLYRIVDLKPLAQTYEEMERNRPLGKLPDGVNVEKKGREVLFKAWPYRCVLWSVWEFLERQGVRWLYPDSHGDFVPAGKGVDLAILPLRFTPSTKNIVCITSDEFQPWPRWMKQSVTEAHLFGARNRNVYWTDAQMLGGGEVPKPPATDFKLKEEYKGGFDGFPHNGCGIPKDVLKAHPQWWGYSKELGKRAPSEWRPMFCMSNPEAIQWVADKMVAVAKASPSDNKVYNLLPMDSCTFCECDQCSKLNSPPEPNPLPWVKMRGTSLCGAYYHFVCEVARAVGKQDPGIVVGALAYADVFCPPSSIARFPENVQVQVCVYGSPNLPVDSPINKGMKQAWEKWHAVCHRLKTYDYSLWQEGSQQVPVAMVAAIVDHAKYLKKIGALEGTCQDTAESLPCNPWNFYAYPRIRWNTEQTADQLLQEFFSGYYLEAAAPMLAYYTAMEDYQLRENVDMHVGGYQYGVRAGAFPLELLSTMNDHLAEAERRATYWVVRQRVTKARESLEWLAGVNGVGMKRLRDGGPYPVMGPGRPPITVALRLADVVPAGSSRNGDAALHNRVRFGHLVRFEADGEYVVSFSGAGYTESRHRRDRMDTAYVDGDDAEPQRIPDGKGVYSFTVTAKKGVREVGIKSLRFGEGPVFVKEFTVRPK